ncbi:MAG: SUMF1/EgtB/PvdO family nonheme iron enzyme [Candidatus Competibacteraceae bacterium]
MITLQLDRPLHLRVFLASPGDVAEERKLACEVLWELQHDPFLRGHVTLEAVAWDYPPGGAPIVAAMPAQDAVTLSRGKPSECDIVVVILWSRFGLPIQGENYAKPGGGGYYTGTEWEYKDAWQAAKAQGKPRLLLYRRTEKPSCELDPANEATILEQLKQLKEVDAFCKACHASDGSIPNAYEKLSDFECLFEQHLREIIYQLLGLQQQAVLNPTGPDLRVSTAQYLRYLLDRHKYLSFKGFGLSERVPLKLPLLEMYVPLQARLEMPPGEKGWNHSSQVGGRPLPLSGPRPVLTLLQDNDGLVILGDPGAGKTTFLKYLALRLARGEGGELGLGERLPILVPLSGYANALEKGDVRLDDFIADHFHNIGANLPLKTLLSDALQCGVALVLLDGLDEVQDTQLRQLVVERVVDFYTLHRQGGNKFVLTSRIIGYREVRRTVPGLAECTLVDFDEVEITKFVDRWTRALETQAQDDTPVARADAEREKRELMDAVQRNEGVRRLAANPLLLTILALMKRQGVTLPERRVELYDHYIKTLLSTWNRARSLGRPPTHDLDLVQIVKIMAPLALWMHEVNPGVGLVKREDLRRKLEALYQERGEANPDTCARRFLADVHEYAGLLVERGPGEYGFIHLTFEEYLAAVAIALQHQGDAKAIAQVLGTHVSEPAWYEISLLTVSYVGLIQQQDAIAGSIVENLIMEQPDKPGVAVALAGEAVVDAWPGGVTPASKGRVVNALVEAILAENVPAPQRCRAGRVLARLGDPRPGVGLTAEGLPDLLWVRIPGTEAVRASGLFPNFMGLKLGNGVKPDPMADNNEAWPNQAKPLEITDFELAAYPVTVAQFRPFVEQGGYQDDHYWSKTGLGWRGRHGESWTMPNAWLDQTWTLPNHPVTGVSWYEAEAYCNWLNEKLKLPRGTIRLPTEAEWEWAARGPQGQCYPWGENWEVGRCNDDKSGINRTSAVGCFPCGAADWWRDIWPGNEVVQDLAGNVRQWMASKYAKHYSGADQSALNAEPGLPCVLHGSSWRCDHRELRAAARFGSEAFNRNSDWGFRLAKSVDFLT